MKVSSKLLERLLLLCLFSACFAAGEAAAGDCAESDSLLRIPDKDVIQILTLDNGSVIFGRILQINGDEITFGDSAMILKVKVASVKSIQEVPAATIKKGKYWFPNPNDTRLYFAPTGRMLKRGEGYFSDFYLFFPGVYYGLTDRITLGGGVSLFPGIDLSKQMYYLTPKVGVEFVKGVDIALGALLINMQFDEEGNTVGILYSVATVGSREASFTIGLGYGFVNSVFARKPMLMLGGETRVSRRIALLTENWIMPGEGQPIIAYGCRFFGEKLSIDLAMVTPLGEDAIFPGIPLVGFVFNF